MTPFSPIPYSEMQLNFKAWQDRTVSRERIDLRKRDKRVGHVHVRRHTIFDLAKSNGGFKMKRTP